MQGEFRGDFTRDTFDPFKHFSRVLMQQGRVQLDADWNEQTSILLHYLRHLAADLIGPHGGPGDAFKIDKRTDDENKPVAWDFSVQTGHYYVDGVLCENAAAPLAYTQQSGFPFSDNDPVKGKNDGSYLVYLDVWERHVTCVEDDSICEVALGGPDTATRAQVVWQIKVEPSATPAEAKKFLSSLLAGTTAKLRARAKQNQISTGPCCIHPESRYRGPENQLYRVEIHRHGNAWDGTTVKNGNPPDNVATFKWSRDNSSVVFPILALADDAVKLANLGRDSRRSLKVDDWVEFVDDDLALRGEPGPLYQVASVRMDDMTVTLKPPVKLPYDQQSSNHPLLRRWDQTGKDGALPVSAGDGEEDQGWITLEDGIQIQFPKIDGTKYRAGEYWLIPARTATGDVVWPKQQATGGQWVPAALPPNGIEHHYAPLAFATFNGAGEILIAANGDLRRTFKTLTTP